MQVLEETAQRRGRFGRGAPSEERELPEAPALRRLIGPSIILIGVGIASGEYILYPFIASQAGLVFLWAAVVGILVQFFINMEIERYTLATGETALGGFMRLWKPWGGILGAGAILATMWPGLGDVGGDDRDLRLRRRRPERDRDRRRCSRSASRSRPRRSSTRPSSGSSSSRSARCWCSSSSRCSRPSARNAWQDTNQIVTSVGTFPTSEISIAILVGALGGLRRRRREQPRAEQLDPRQGLRHGQVRAADRLADHRQGGGGADQ